MKLKSRKSPAPKGTPKTKSSGRVSHGPSSPDRAANSIANSILVGRCVPGQRLIEGDLSRDLQVSRGTVREALKRLAAERVITLTPHRGAYVRALSRTEALELLQVLNVLYGLAASLAASHIAEADNRKKLTTAYERLRADGPNSDRILHSIDRSSFYDVFFAISGNRELVRINPVLPTQILRMQVHPFLSPADLQKLFADYRLLFDAIVGRDGRKARRIIDVHIERRRSQIKRLAPEAFAAGRTGAE